MLLQTAQGRVKVGWPGWIFIEGSAAAMVVFTKRVKAEHWRRIQPRFDEAVPCDFVSDRGALDALRLFPDGMQEVDAEAFCAAFRSREREDILIAGTGMHLDATSKTKAVYEDSRYM